MSCSVDGACASSDTTYRVQPITVGSVVQETKTICGKAVKPINFVCNNSSQLRNIFLLFISTVNLVEFKRALPAMRPIVHSLQPVVEVIGVVNARKNILDILTGNIGPKKVAEGDVNQQQVAEGNGGQQQVTEGNGSQQQVAEGNGSQQQVAEGNGGQQQVTEGNGSQQQVADYWFDGVKKISGSVKDIATITRWLVKVQVLARGTFHGMVRIAVPVMRQTIVFSVIAGMEVAGATAGVAQTIRLLWKDASKRTHTTTLLGLAVDIHTLVINIVLWSCPIAKTVAYISVGVCSLTKFLIEEYAKEKEAQENKKIAQAAKKQGLVYQSVRGTVRNELTSAGSVGSPPSV